MISQKRKKEILNMTSEEINNENFSKEEKRFIQNNGTCSGAKVIGTFKRTEEEIKESRNKFLKRLAELEEINIENIEK